MTEYEYADFQGILRSGVKSDMTLRPTRNDSLDRYRIDVAIQRPFNSIYRSSESFHASASIDAFTLSLPSSLKFREEGNERTTIRSVFAVNRIRGYCPKCDQRPVLFHGIAKHRRHICIWVRVRGESILVSL